MANLLGSQVVFEGQRKKVFDKLFLNAIFTTKLVVKVGNE